jgi:hypothetical protein
MCRPDAALAFPQPLTPSQIADFRLAASKMTGAKRRAFETAMPLQYSEGHPLQAATTLIVVPYSKGGRQAVGPS